ncbi:MAG: hypothetical protein QW775_07235 [Ignisphaera sp.]|uniref:Uncharacterized protein n=1 Tax=Ignisphaera aggregans TaxID=334771 RepID=A0A7C4JL87_9CREN
MGEPRTFSKLLLVIIFVVAIVFSCLGGYAVGVYIKPFEITTTLTKTETIIFTETVTFTYTMLLYLPSPSPILNTTVSELGNRFAYVERGERLSVIMPFIYIDKSVLYSEDRNSMIGKWVVNGSYSFIEDGLLIGSEGMCTIAYNDVVKVEGYKVYRLRLSIRRIDGEVRFSLSSVSQLIVNRFVSVVIDRYRYTSVYLQDRKATNQRSIDLGSTSDIEILFAYALRAVEIFVKRRGIDEDWILLAQVSTQQLWLYDTKITVEVCNSSIVLEDLTVYELAGTGIRDLRPVFDWGNGKYNPGSILKDREGYMIFFATAGFYRQPLGILILRTKDMVSYEPVKLVIIKGIPSYTGQGFLFKWVDGKIHGYLMNWGGSYQGGIHRIVKVVLDEDFSLVELNESITLVNPPPGGVWGHYDIALLKFNGTWYAITSSFTAGTILWKIESPTSTVFTYVKTVFEKGRENPCIYPVVSPTAEIKLMISLATDAEYGSRHKIYVLDKDFNPIEEYDIISYRVWSAGHSFYLDPWYIYINQDQVLERRFTSGDIWPGAYIEVYRLKTNYRYFIEE